MATAIVHTLEYRLDQSQGGVGVHVLSDHGESGCETVKESLGRLVMPDWDWLRAN